MNDKNLKTKLILAVCAMMFLPIESTADWPAPAIRSGTTLPEPRTISALAQISGVYVPQVEGLSSDSTGIIGGTLVWNIRLIGDLGLFGMHSISGMGWKDSSDNEIRILTFGHEVGARFLLGPYLSFEAAYLGHRIEYIWLNGDPWTLGGDHDHGGEIGTWGHFEPFDKVRLAGHLLARKFAEPTGDGQKSYTDQLVFGMGLGVQIMPWNGHALALTLETLRIYRGNQRRAGVEETTWNVLGKIMWRSALAEKFGLQLGMRASTSWLCGEVPMLEYKRSMIDEPMAELFAGIYFFI
ncbi:MAG: hypothetical protein GY854_18520 [Deltaproteobacteria bacterium]|nr:hypothetical protein [Deltaproteobacteria bacterium]